MTVKGRAILTIVFISVIFTACGIGNRSIKTFADRSARQSETNADLTGSVLVVGSTVLQPLVEQAAEKFMQQNKHKDITVQVQGGGSGMGLTQVLEGLADIGTSDVFAQEKLHEADPQQVKGLIDHKVAVVGIAFVTHPAVGVNNLTKRQLLDIFRGKTKNWKEVGGIDQKIVLLNRPVSSGTRTAMEKYALGMFVTDIEGSIQQDSPGALKKLTAETPGAISYLAFTHLDQTVNILNYDGVQPTIENVENDKYPVWTYLHMYTKGSPSPCVQAFLNYMLSDEVQQSAIENFRYVSIHNMKVKRCTKHF